MFFACFELVILAVVYFFVSLLDSFPRPFESGAGKQWMSSMRAKKSADGINSRASKAQKQSEEMPQQSVQDEIKNDDDHLETFVFQTA